MTISGAIFDIAQKEKRLAELEQMIAQEGFWNDIEATKSVMQERTRLQNALEHFAKINAKLEDAHVMLELGESEDDRQSLDDAENTACEVAAAIGSMRIEVMLSAEEDVLNAIVSINAGAGGTEAQDWAEMLYRMYSRWVERKGFEMELMDYQSGEEAGLKSVTFIARGAYAYGYLKTEVGIHRLVRISPFNAGGKRHTSFASVFVYPELNNEIVIDINPADLRIDTYRASGAGGQHVNKTSSAVRITHLPTGIVVQCQDGRSQHSNRDNAMKVLMARLYQQEKSKQDAKMQAMHDGKNDIAWGNQIRSYILQPYQMAKDHRLGLDIGNVYDVLDGGIDPFIEGILLQK